MLPGLTPGKSHVLGLPSQQELSACSCTTGLMHCPLLGNGKNCSSCLVEQCQHSTGHRACPGVLGWSPGVQAVMLGASMGSFASTEISGFCL